MDSTQEKMIDNMKPNYKIFCFNDSIHHVGRTVIERFYAKTDDDAYAYLLKFRENAAAKGDTTEYYYATIFYTHIVNDDGSLSPEFEIGRDHLSAICSYSATANSVLKRTIENIADIAYDVIEFFKDIRRKVRDFVYLLKNKESYSNQWSLDLHLIDTLALNVPKLIENSMALAFYDVACEQMKRKDPSFDIELWNKDPEKEKLLEELAEKIQKEEYAALLQHVKLYKYYAELGYADSAFTDSNEAIEFDKKWRHTLPIKPGTYDEFSSYEELHRLAKEQWDMIWDWVKKYGDKLND